MDATNIICPVCTLYLRQGITLKQHLSSHPKQRVIDALVELSANGNNLKLTDTSSNSASEPSETALSNSTIVNQSWNNQTSPSSTNIAALQGNHLFIYQQSMSTTTPQPNVLNINPLTQQYVIPTIFNPQMMPYVYQQQQVIMSSNGCVPSSLKALPFDMSSTTDNNEVPVMEITEESCSSIEKTDEITPDACVEVVEEKQEVTEDELNVSKEDIDSGIGSYNLVDEKSVSEYGEQHNEELDLSTNATPVSAWDLKLQTDLNKACQTQTSSSPAHPAIQDEDLEHDNQEEDHPEYYYVDQPSEEVPFSEIRNINSNSLSEPIYTSSNILQSNDHIDFVEMDGMRVIIGDFSSNQIISQVENFESSHGERPGVLMTIGDITDGSKTGFHEPDDETVSRGSSNVNIRADERMPPRGELSGQESLGGASDITWNRIQYHEGSSGMSGSYDLLARESWEASDSSDVEMPPLQSRLPMDLTYPENEYNDDTPTIVSFSGPPLNFKCPICEEAFANSKERKEHEITKHPEKIGRNLIGSEIGKKKVKKLTVKPKTTESEPENNFNVFTNKLKLETNADDQTDIVALETPLIEAVKIDEAVVAVDLKTVCPLCDCVLPNAKALKLHKYEVHKVSADVRHKCATCGEAFPNEYKYTQHLKLHPLECRMCGKLFFRRQNMQLHMKRHLGLKPYKCELCQKSFVTKQKHDEHKNTHTGEAPIKCALCSETFRRHSNLVQHRNRHHFNLKKKLKDYICFCGEVFHSKKKLAWHKEIHDAKPKSCTQCSEKFVHMSSLTRHMRRAHNEKFLPNTDRSSENVECPICKGIYLRSSLEVHIRNHSGQKPFTCLICSKDFTTKWNLKLHKWTHASRTSKPYKCDQCKGAFIRESDYIAHMNSHKSVRPYTCNYCGAQFIRKYNCQRHVKEHENGKTFNCQVCGKSFHRSYYLKDHMRVHSGIRPYACHICGKTSTTKSNHNKHVQIHHAREPVSTEN